MRAEHRNRRGSFGYLRDRVSLKVKNLSLSCDQFRVFGMAGVDLLEVFLGCLGQTTVRQSGEGGGQR